MLVGPPQADGMRWRKQTPWQRHGNAIMELTGKQKRSLRALGHHLRPVMTLGKQGIGEAVLAQLDANLLAHELVKVKVLKTCPLDTGAVAAALTAGTGAALAQSMGRTLLLYRPHPDFPQLVP